MAEVDSERFDLGLVVALGEEFEWITEVLPKTDERLIGRDSYFVLTAGGGRRIITKVVDGMGLIAAAIATDRLCREFRLPALALLGIAGALSDDLALGDVFIADEIQEYLHASKATPRGQGYRFALAGSTWRSEYALLQPIRDLSRRSSSATRLGEWQQAAIADLEEYGIDPAGPPKVRIGALASGDIVGSSSAFAAWLRDNVNRKLEAIEMEAAGVALSANSREVPVPFLVIRGISDRADEAKQQVDRVEAVSGQRGIWRKIATRNAARLLDLLLDLGIVDVSSSRSVTIEDEPFGAGSPPAQDLNGMNDGPAPGLSELRQAIESEAQALAERAWDAVRTFREKVDFATVCRLLDTGRSCSAIGGQVHVLLAERIDLGFFWSGAEIVCTIDGLPGDDPPLESAHVRWRPGESAANFIMKVRLAMMNIGLAYWADAVTEVIFERLERLVCTGLAARTRTVPDQFSLEDLPSSDLGPILSLPGAQWAVTERGLESTESWPYVIEFDRMHELDWIPHMTGKTWVDADDFVASFRYAKRFLPPSPIGG